MALLSGFLLDLVSGAPFGLLTLALLAVGLLCGLEEVRQVQFPLLLPVMIVGASLMHYVLLLLGLRLGGWPIAWRDGLLFVAVPTTLMNGALALLLAPLVQRWRSAIQAEEATP